MLKVSRRTFLSKTAVASAALAAFGSAPFGFSQVTSQRSPNDRLGLAIIGCGWWGHDQLLRYFLQHRERLNVEIVAVCDVWSIHRDRAVATVEASTGRRPKAFIRYQGLLEERAVDAVVIATPDFSHCPILIDAARAGKHVFVEKPLANRLEDANAALDAVRENRIICQVDTQRRSDPRFAGGANLVQSGVLGKIVRIDCVWPTTGARWNRDFSDVRRDDVDWDAFLVNLPKQEFDPRRFRCWQLYKDYSNGIIGVLGSHLLDVAHWYSQDPLPLRGIGMGNLHVYPDRENDDAQECVYHYPQGHLVRFSGRLGNGHPANHVAVHGTRGYFDTLSWEATGEGGARNDRIEEPVPIEPVTLSNHNDNWIDCIRRNDPATRADIRAGYSHSVAAILGFQAIEQRRELQFDPEMRAFS